MGEPSRSHLDDIGTDTPTVDLAKSLRFVAKWTLSPPHPVPLQEAAKRLDRMAELEAIVRALAALPPPTGSDEETCWFCDTVVAYGNVPPGEHEATCAWRQARELFPDAIAAWEAEVAAPGEDRASG